MRNDRRRIARGLGAALLFAAAACAGCAKPVTFDQTLRVWPAPPAAQRICLRKVIRGTEDIRQTGALGGLARLLVGSAEQTFHRPQGVAVDDQDRVYIADQDLQGVHVIELKTSKVRFIDQVGKEFFISPVAVAWCDGVVAVSDSGRDVNKVFLMTPKGKRAGEVVKPGGFGRPTGLAWDPAIRRLYVSDTVAGEVCAFELTGEAGQMTGRLAAKIGRPGREVGQLNAPTHVAVGPDGRLYVADSLNFRVQAFDREGQAVAVIGKAGDATGHMAMPKGLGVDAFGHVYVADSSLAAVQIFDGKGQFLLGFGERGDFPGGFYVPSGLAVHGRLIFVCDFDRRCVQVFEYVGQEESHEQQATP